MGEKFNRPWGYYEVLSDTPDHKVKRIVIKPEARLSLQRHKLRNEHWFIVSGKGKVSVNSKNHFLEAGCCIDIPALSFHRIENSSADNLILIEVQTGEYFGEDDIERLEDDYGRV